MQGPLLSDLYRCCVSSAKVRALLKPSIVPILMACQQNLCLIDLLFTHFIITYLIGFDDMSCLVCFICVLATRNESESCENLTGIRHALCCAVNPCFHVVLLPVCWIDKYILI